MTVLLSMMYAEAVVVAMKRRTQIYLNADQDRQLTYLARARRCSKSQLIRESIARYLRQEISVADDPALKILGVAGKGGLHDLSERHDDVVTQAVQDETAD